MTSLPALTSCSYIEARAADFLDVFMIEASYGPGVHAGIQLTDFVGTGVGYSSQTGVGLYGRYAGVAEREAAGLPTIYLSRLKSTSSLQPVIESSIPPPSDTVLSPGFQGNILMAPWYWWWKPAAAPHDWFYRGIRSFDVSVGFSAGVGAHVGFSPGELLDFLLGWTTLDIAGDDVSDQEEGDSRQIP